MATGVACQVPVAIFPELSITNLELPSTWKSTRFPSPVWSKVKIALEEEAVAETISLKVQAPVIVSSSLRMAKEEVVYPSSLLASKADGTDPSFFLGAKVSQTGSGGVPPTDTS